MGRRVIFSFIILSILAFVTILVIGFGRGYRLDFGNKNVTTTGILKVSSYPEGASIFINDVLKAATNNSLSLTPSWYTIKVTKEGYIPWQKKLRIQGEIVTQADVLLIPQNPSFRPLTTSGVIHPARSPSGNQIAYISPFDATSSANPKKKDGIYLWNMKEGSPLPFSGTGPKLLARSTPILNYNLATLLFSPDEKELLAIFFKNNDASTIQSVYRLDTQLIDQVPVNVTESLYETLASWDLLRQEIEKTTFSSLPDKLSTVLNGSVKNVLFSLDEKKIMYTATASASIPAIINPPLIGSNTSAQERNLTPNTVYIYDLKEDKNFKVKTLPSAKPTEKPIFRALGTSLPVDTNPFQRLLTLFADTSSQVQWYPDSEHLVMIENNTIYISEYDGQNKTTVYAGPFEDSYIFTWPTGGKIAILTNYNTAASKFPNLYAVDIR